MAKKQIVKPTKQASKAERGAVPTNPFQSRGERDYSDEREAAASRGRRADPT